MPRESFEAFALVSGRNRFAPPNSRTIFNFGRSTSNKYQPIMPLRLHKSFYTRKTTYPDPSVDAPAWQSRPQSNSFTIRQAEHSDNAHIFLRSERSSNEVHRLCEEHEAFSSYIKWKENNRNRCDSSGKCSKVASSCYQSRFCLLEQTKKKMVSLL